MTLSGSSVSLGGDLVKGRQQLNFAKLNVNSAGTVSVRGGASFELVGSSTVGDWLNLVSEGMIWDASDAHTSVQTSARLAAMEVYLGELETGCFDIIDDATNLLINAQESEVVVSGCSPT